MTRFALPLTFALALIGTSALAQQVVPGGNLLARWDADKDGRVTLAEVRSGREALFRLHDTNRDGALSPAEFDRIAPQSAGGRQANNQRRVQRALRGQLDTNADGFVSLKEYVAGAEPWRDRMDLDGDGVLSSSDFGRSGQGRGLRWNNG